MLAGFVTLVSPAQSDDPAPTPRLPDLRQELPTAVQLAQINGSWRLGFGSEVSNTGAAYLKITGTGVGNQPMEQVTQTIQMSDGSSTTVPVNGTMHYVIGGGHEHWHLLDFERYELRSAADPGTPILKDQKTGFCLADDFTTDLCGRNHPELTTVSEGIGVGGSDKYLGYLEGQYITIDEATVPTGDYLLVNRVNPTGALEDADDSDNAASLRLKIVWTSGAPQMTVTNKCLASVDCPPPPDPLPTADPEPQPDPRPAPAPQQILPAPDPEPVPVVPPSQFAPPTAKPSMSRSMAGRLVRRAIQKSTREAPRALRTTCSRKSADTFACNSSWQGERRARWSGRVRVWYRLTGGVRLAWFYSLTAVRHPGGQGVVMQAVQGSASRAVFQGATRALFCALPPRP